MLPSKKSIRKMSTQPFPGWVLSFVKNADDYCGSLIMFSIKIIEHKKYLVGKGINADGKFLSVISKEGDILTLLENGRWSVACINQHISSNATVFNGACVYKFFNDDDKEGRSVYNTLCSHILSRKEKLKIMHMAENQRAKNEMWKCVPKAPHEFLSFCYDDYGYKVVFSTKDRKTGFCGKCLKKITFQKNLVSRHNYKCPYCHKDLTAVSYKQLSSRRIFKCYSMLDIYDDDRLMVRHFDVSEVIRAKVESGYIQEIKADRSIDEYERDLFDLNRTSFSYHIRKYDFTTGVLFWQNSKPSEGYHLVGTLPNRYYASEKIYKGNLNSITQKISGISDVIDSILQCISNGVVDSQRLEELILGSKNTMLAEKLEKIGLINLSSHVIFQSIRSFCYDAKFNEYLPYTVKEFIKCNKRFLKFAVENNIDYLTLRCMQHFNEKFTDKFEDFMLAYNYCKSKKGENVPNSVNRIVDFCVTYKVTVRQVVSYLEKQSGSIIELQDYVSMYLEAYSLSHNTTYSVLEYSKHFLFPQDLMQSHDDALNWLNREKDKREKKKIIKKNKMLLSIIEPLHELDGKDIGNFKFSFPHSKSDFVHQGDLMHICVGKFNYFDKMCEGKNYICFVAKANKPYATVEFKKEENNQLSLVQARAYGNGNVTSDCTEQINKFKNLLEATVLSNLLKK